MCIASTNTVEKYAASLVDDYADLTRGFLDARETARVNFERVRDAADTARTTVKEGARKA